MCPISKSAALSYHQSPQPGKIAVRPTKPLKTQQDLSLAYTPGVAYPVLEIDQDPQAAYDYTARGNLVGVISNGSAILGLGNRGALASKPVMEGKAVLFKAFADIDVFDIELDTEDPNTLVEVVRTLAPTFGGINLEDIKAPECFYIESRLRELLDIPVFHDDQHGTAVILGAAILNAMAICGKDYAQAKVVFSGAGAAGVACANQLIKLGFTRSHIWMVDIDGLIYPGREENMLPQHQDLANGDGPQNLALTLEDADIFIGLSAPNIVTPDMLQRMAPNPIIFPMANPDPEIKYPLAVKARPDAIVGTGRSDFPNQINNVLGFPFIFRGALDVRASTIDDGMKLAASHALAELAREPVPQNVLDAYSLDRLAFGRDYVVPKPLDPRVPLWVAPAVAQAAMASGTARQILDIEDYRDQLRERLSKPPRGSQP